jgi:hypothetical protein
MRITRQTPQELVVEDSTLLVAALCTLCAVGPIAGSFAQHKLLSFAVAALLLLIASLWVRKTRFVFDAMARVVRWQGRKMLRVESGEIPFSEIRDVTTEAQSSGEGTSYRLALQTAQGTIPMAYAYGGNRKRVESIRQTVLTYLNGGAPPATDPARDLDTSVRALLAQGRKIDAIALIRSTTHVGLTEAVQRVEALERTAQQQKG